MRPRRTVRAAWIAALLGLALTPTARAGAIAAAAPGAHVAHVVPGAPARLAALGAVLELDAGAVAAPTDVEVLPLGEAEVAPLDPGMTNVSAGEARAWRFRPDGSRFARALRLTLPYDPHRLPPGATAEDVRAFYYDVRAARWTELERVAVLPAAGTVTSLTTHFTDILLATVSVPDHAEVASAVPTTMSDMKAADPTTGLDLIAPPSPNAFGDARLSLPIELPPGRAGMQPELALEYRSRGGNGWLGVGWQLGVPEVAVDTRWGVPRYGVLPDAAGTLAFRDLETESYTADGAALTPNPNTAAFAPRAGTERVFHARIEGRFDRIVRHGDHPSRYWWEITDRDGVTSVYGEPPGVPAGTATLRDSAGNVFRWALREMRDVHGNAMRFTYALARDPGIPGGSLMGSQLYLESVNYTGRVNASGAYEPGAFTVRFVRDTDPALAPRTRRSDVQMDARGGFLQVTAELLRRVVVEFDGAVVRRYDLAYESGGFGVTRLVSVEQRGADGVVFPGATHRFEYYDDVQKVGTAYPDAFAPDTSWSVPDDDVTLCTDLGLIDVCPSVFVPGYDDASLLGGANTQSIAGHGYVGLNCGSPTKENSAGFKVGYTYSNTDTRLALVDVDGDGLPDKVVHTDAGFSYRANEARPGGANAFSATSRPLPGLTSIGTETADTWAGGFEAYPLKGSVLTELAGTSTVGSAYSTDANGDGIADFVQDGQIQFGRLDDQGHPAYATTSDDTPIPLAPGVLDGGSLVPDNDPRFQDLVDRNPLLDVFRRWLAPWDGDVRITGEVRLATPARSTDGARVSIQLNDAVLWSAVLPGGDASAHVPAGVTRVHVARGDRLYFRVQSVFDGSGDAVSWDPDLQYLDVTAEPDANGFDPYHFRASSDYVLAGRAARARMPFSGTARFTGTFVKPARTTDDVAVTLRRNGAEILRVPMPWDSVGTVKFDSLFTVTGDDTSTRTVDESDLVDVRIVTDSPIDARAVVWDEGSPPALTYETIDGKPVDLRPGVPAARVIVPSDVDLFPATDRVVPPVAWVAPDTGTVDVTVSFGGLWSFRDPFQTEPVRDGSIGVTLKRAGGLAGRTRAAVVNNIAAKTATIGRVHVNKGDRLFLDLTLRSPEEIGAYTAIAVYESTLSASVVPCALEHDVAFDDVPTLGRGLYAQPFRGWTCAGYNGNPPAGSPDRPHACVLPRPVPTAPIVESNLVLTGAQPTWTDQKAYPFSPVTEPMRNGVLRSSWRGPDDSTWVRAGGACASRLGLDVIGVPCPSDLAGGARAVPKTGGSFNAGIALGLVVGASGSTGTGAGELDFLDMNGDGFPDPVGNGVAQYTLPNGGLEDKSRPLAGMDTVRTSSNIAGSLTLEGSWELSKGNSKGKAGASNKTAPAGERTENLMVSLGFSGDLGGGKSDAERDLADLNGDGLPDRIYDDGTVALNLGYAFGPREAWPNLTQLESSTNWEFTLAGGIGFNDRIYGWAGGLSYSRAYSKTSAALLDLNGDGLPDRIRDDGGVLEVAFNTGTGFAPEASWQGVTLADGLASSANAALGAGAFFTIGIPIFLCSPVSILYLIVNPGAMVATGMARQETALLDIDGDGCADYLRSSHQDALTVAKSRVGRTNLLRRVERPLGGRLTLDYARAGNTPDMPQSVWVLASVLTDDGLADDGPSLLATMRYDTPRFARGEREFLGFAHVVEEHRDATAPAIVLRSVERTYRNDSYYSRGLLAAETTRDAAGRVLRGAEFGWEFRDVASGAPAGSLASRSAAIYPMMVRKDNRLAEGVAGPGLLARRLFEYDAVGQVVRVEDTGSADPADDDQAEIAYADCGASHVLDRASSIVVTGGGATLSERHATIAPATGDLLQVRQRLADGTEAVTDLGYSADGQLTSLVGPANLHGQRQALTYEYDPRLATHVTRVADSYGLASSAEYDLRFGRPTRTVDANGSEVAYAYDAFGRVTAVTGGYETGAGEPSLTFEYHPEAARPWARSRHHDVLNPGDPIESVLFVDGLGRVVQTKVDATVHTSPGGPPRDVMVVSGRSRYDALGRCVEEHQPVVEPLGDGPAFDPAFDATEPARTEFDALDRATSVTRPDGARTRYAYALAPDARGLLRSETTILDANGHARRVYRDAQDQTVAIREGDDGALWTSYGYDALGRLTSVTDARGNATTMAYDALGRRTVLVRPDAGETRYEYDAASNLVALRTANLIARGAAIRYDYDFTRLRSVRYPGDDAPSVNYAYGAPGAPEHAAGRITRITDDTGIEERGYGPLGEMVRQTRTVVGHAGWNDFKPGTWTTTFRYDTWARLLGMTYPDGEALTYGYDAGGLVRAITSRVLGHDYTYLRALEYDRNRQPAWSETGNGVQTSYEYDPLTQRLARARARSVAAGEFQDLRFTYDGVGNVLTAANEVPLPKASGLGGPTAQEFTYDDLYRLVGARGSWRFAPNKSDEYTLALRYDAVHNLLEKRQTHDIVGPSGKRVPQGATTYALGYAYGAAQPHAAVHVGDRTCTYDANGNLTGWTDDTNGTRQTLAWDDDDRVRSIAVQGHELRFAYDAAGSRVLFRGPSGEVVTVNPFYSVRNGSLATKHVYAGNVRLATRPAWPGGKDTKGASSPNDDHVFYYQPDQRGSTQFVTDETGAVAEHMEYLPFGETWVEEHKGPDRASVLYAGREQDDVTGYYWFGDRYQDPVLGRFLSVDPASAAAGEAIAAANPASLNPYAFALDNPVRLTEGSQGPAWWSGWWHTFALAQGVGGRSLAGSGLPSAVPQQLGDTDSPASAEAGEQAGDYLADAGVGVIAAMPAPEARIGRTNAKDQSTAGPEPRARTRAGASRPRSDAVVGEGPAQFMDEIAPVVIGENASGRVLPYARGIGAETIEDFLGGREWTGELNDQFVAKVRAKGQQVIDIGPDVARGLRAEGASSNRRAYEATREALRGYEKVRSVFQERGKESVGVPGLDRAGKAGEGAAGLQP